MISNIKKTKNVLKFAGQKIVSFAKSRIVKRVFPIFGVVSIFKPGVSYALTLNDVGEFSINGAIIAAEYRGIKEVTQQGISSITDPGLRSTVSTAGSIAALVGGLSCGIGSAICNGIGWEQKGMICLHGVGICAGVASGMNAADPLNPATIPGRLAGDAIGKISV